MSAAPFREESVEECLILTLDRPPLNTLDHEAVAALTTRFEACDAVRPVILTGAGRAFSAGVDTKAFAAYDAGARRRFFAAITGMTRALIAIDAPVIAAVNGHALGGGLVLALAADYRLIAEGDARLGLTEARAGVPFPAGPMEIIKAELPAPLMRSLVLSSRVVASDELLRHAVFDEIVPGDQLRAASIARARDMASQPAFAAVKRQTRAALRAAMQAAGDAG